MTNQPKHCPQPKVLLSFLQGKLHPPQLQQCESHLKDCPLCHETLVELSGNDTLSERIAEALGDGCSNDLEKELRANGTDSVELHNLLDQLNSDDFKRDAMRFHPNTAGCKGAVDSEVIADRAAEVLRCITPEAESLGVLGDYTLVRLIGAGSTGVVFQAIDQKLDRTVALKVLRPSLGETARNRFLVEAKLAASIEHTNVVTIFQVGQVGRLAYMAMPWLPGQTLESLLASGEELSEDRIVKIVSQVAAGLNAAHQNQLVHRDIKPANLWICEDDHQLKILDFGLARISDDDPNFTATGMLAGTPNFMSPEQTRGLELDGRSDLFSLGCVFYRLLTRKLPFGAPTVLATLSSIQNDHPTPPKVISPDASQDLSDLTMCLLEKQPANRPQSATQTIELLSSPRHQWPETISSYSGPSYSAATQAHASSTQPSAAGSANNRGNWFRSVILALGLVIIGGAGWMFSPQIIRIATDQGEVVIETDDKNVEVQVIQNGELVRVVDLTTQQSFELKSGKYSLVAVAPKDAPEPKNIFSIEPGNLTMRRGEKAVVKVAMGGNVPDLASPRDNATNSDGSPELAVSKQRALIAVEYLAKQERLRKLKGKQMKRGPLGGERYEKEKGDLRDGLLGAGSEMPEEQLDDSHPASSNQTRLRALKKPFYRGKTFPIWYQTALYDRDVKSRADAIRACAATAESEQEWEQILQLISKLSREYGSRITGLNGKTDYLQTAMIEAIDKSGVNRTLAFFSTEITEGNKMSREFCEKWLHPEISMTPKSRENRQAVASRVVELLDDMNDNLQSPGVIEILEALAPYGERKQEFFDQVRSSRLGEATFKNLLVTGDLQQRLRYRDIALRIYNNDQQILDIYVADLINPKLNGGKFTLRERHQNSGPAARYYLLNSFCRYVFSTDIDLQVMEDGSDPPRINNAVKALAGVTAGVFATGQEKLRFSENHYGGGGMGGMGGGGMGFGMDMGGMNFIPPQLLKENEFTLIFLRNFYDVSKQIRDDKNKQRLVESLGKIKAWQLRTKEKDWPNTGDNTMFANDIKFLLALLQGEELPERHSHSTLWSDGRGGAGGGGVF
jgi:serine/threonine protein kinase